MELLPESGEQSGEAGTHAAAGPADRAADLVGGEARRVAQGEQGSVVGFEAGEGGGEVEIDPALEATASRPGADPASHDAELDLANALAGLEPDDRILIALRYAAGLTSDEIGRAIGMTGGGVRARIARLLARLRTELDE